MISRSNVQEPSPLPADGSPPRRKDPAAVRVLIIDDMPTIHDDFRKILHRADASDLDEAAATLFGAVTCPSCRSDFSVDSAYQGEEGLELTQTAVAEGRPYALAFVDVRMPPGWDGITTIEKLWQADPCLQVVICTAHSDYSWEEVAERLGHSESLLILKKPFDNVEVLQLAHALTKKWALARESNHRLADLDAMVEQHTWELRETNAQLLEQIEERRRAELRIRAFSDLGNRLNSAATAKEAAQIIVDVADQLIGWDACFLDMYSGRGG